jgi:hypothetical protein
MENEVKIILKYVSKHPASELGKMPDIEEQHAENGDTVLHRVASLGFFQKCKDCSFEDLAGFPNKIGFTPLHLACLHGHVEKIEWILAKKRGAGATLTAQMLYDVVDMNNFSALHCIAIRKEKFPKSIGNTLEIKHLLQTNVEGHSFYEFMRKEGKHDIKGPWLLQMMRRANIEDVAKLQEVMKALVSDIKGQEFADKVIDDHKAKFEIEWAKMQAKKEVAKN